MKVKLTGVEKDVVLVLPDGREIEVQYRNYEGDKKTGEGASIDIVLPAPTAVNCYQGVEMKPAKQWGGGEKKSHIRLADQLTFFP
jgi:hypothetical protein